MSLIRLAGAVGLSCLVLACAAPAATPTASPTGVTPTASASPALPTTSPTPTLSPSVTASPMPTVVVPTPSPTASATFPPTPTPSASSQGLSVKWQESTDSGMGGADNILGMAVANGRAVAVGRAYTDGLGIWYSDDGQHWTQATTSDSANIWPVLAVSAGGPGFVAVGADYPDDTVAGFAFFSSDGASWQRVDPPAFVGYAPRFIGLAGGTLFAFGSQGSAFSSVDGSTWQPALDNASVKIADGLLALAQDGSTLWAFSSDPDPAHPKHPLLDAWRSTDGLGWTKMAALPDSGDPLIASAAVGPKGIAVFAKLASNTGGADRAWHSADGSAWQTAVNYPTDSYDVVAAQAGFVATGHYNTGSGCVIDDMQDVGVTWSSVDGLVWRQVAKSGWDGREVLALGLMGPRLIGLGVDWLRNEGDQGMVWTADLPASAQDTLPAPTPAPSPTPAGGC
jgi:hypothetical protein